MSEPPGTSGEDITIWLARAREGDIAANDRLYRAVYAHFRTLAASQRRRWYGNDTMGTTALIHEAFLKLSGGQDYHSRVHFFATAAKAMRQILINYAESQRAEKRGGDLVRLPLEDADLQIDMTATHLIDVERILAEMEAENPRRVRIVECRLFGGMGVEETAGALGISTATVKREWRLASAWLTLSLSGDADGRVDDDP